MDSHDNSENIEKGKTTHPEQNDYKGNGCGSQRICHYPLLTHSRLYQLCSSRLLTKEVFFLRNTSLYIYGARLAKKYNDQNAKHHNCATNQTLFTTFLFEYYDAKEN